MILDSFIGSYALSVWLADRVNSLGPVSAGRDNVAALANEIPGPNISVYNPVTNTLPAWQWMQAGGYGLLLIDGCRTVAVASTVTGGYLFNENDNNADPVNPAIDSGAGFIARNLPLEARNDTRHIFLAGHSYGGALAEAVARRLVLDSWGQSIKWVSFGAPRLGGRTYVRGWQRAQGVRWMHDADPVPLSPPRTVDFFALALVVGPQVAVRFSNFWHPAGGVRLFPPANAEASELPEFTFNSWPLNFGAWLFGLDTDPFSPHSLQSYRNFLFTLVPVPYTTSAGIFRTAPVESGTAASRRDENRAEQAAVARLNVIERQQQAVPVKIPPAKAFQAVRIGRVWYVTFGGEVISLAGPKRRARALARQGNEFLARLPGQAVVDTAQLSAQFTAFLAAAQDPASGIVPLFNTAF